ncbi:Methyl-accepting chemotaxis protein McpS [Marinomonas spartinae]|uniref:methyl-accepting chemotaxis protein n=1 Tax=Marinomonas spartinae TaxID=1792290 RepID=UPI000808EDA5|nr:methyl-accepting chemotaxis protein [Marinomonas spartinae]SBS27337.1 Methyl-accepting chemotaxis protein McpS [Marinomonas spartinae]
MLRNLGIRLRLQISFLVIILLLVCLGMVAISAMKGIRANSKTIEEKVVPAIISLGSMNGELMRVRIFTFRLLNDGDEKDKENTLEAIEKIKENVAGFEGDYEKTLYSEGEKSLFEQFKEQQDHYFSVQRQVVSLAMKGQKDAVSDLLPSMNRSADDMVRLLKALVSASHKGANQARLESVKEYNNSFLLIAIIIAAAAAMAAAIALVISKSINKPLQEAVDSAESIAKGDLTQLVTVQGNDELTRLSSALKLMQGNLREAIVHIGDSSGQLSSAAEELSSVTESSSNSLMLQNNEIQQAAAAITEMSAAVDDVARTAQQASETSAESAKLASEGKARVAQTTSVILEMNDEMFTSSQVINQLAEQISSIGKILDVIRDIADQTNLLALNAAIEAARAGEAGRGFAVVADEVRSLAHRTQESTGEIETMVHQVQMSASEAVASMDSTGQKSSRAQRVAAEAVEALEQISAHIVSITDYSTVVATSTEQQSHVAKEIDSNLTTISDLASQTVVGANQTSASAAELTRLAIELNSLVLKFKV